MAEHQRVRGVAKGEEVAVSRQLVCEGQCNHGMVQVMDRRIRAARRTSTAREVDESRMVTALGDDDIRDLRGLKHTPHQYATVREGKEIWRCEDCGQERIYGSWH